MSIFSITMALKIFMKSLSKINYSFNSLDFKLIGICIRYKHVLFLSRDRSVILVGLSLATLDIEGIIKVGKHPQSLLFHTRKHQSRTILNVYLPSRILIPSTLTIWSSIPIPRCILPGSFHSRNSKRLLVTSQRYFRPIEARSLLGYTIYDIREMLDTFVRARAHNTVSST